jgi:hypothetical protein
MTTDPTTAPAPLPQARPLVYVDVDGVLQPDRPGPGYQPHRYNGPGPDGSPVTGTVWLHPQHGAWLAELAAAGTNLVWATSWRHLANSFVAPHLGLPGTWPVLDIAATGVAFGYSVKRGPVLEHAGTRPFAWLDDDFGPRDPQWATHRTRHEAPTLLVPVDPYHGLTRQHVDTVLAWLATLTP